MTELLKQAMALMRELPDELQDVVARQIMRHIDEISDLDNHATIAEDQKAFELRLTLNP
jgi:adenylate kinase